MDRMKPHNKIFLALALLSIPTFVLAKEKLPKSTTLVQESLRYERDLLAIKKLETKFQEVSIPWIEKCTNALSNDIEVGKRELERLRIEKEDPTHHRPLTPNPEIVRKSAEGMIAFWEKRIPDDEELIQTFGTIYTEWKKYFDLVKTETEKRHQARVLKLEEKRKKFVADCWQMLAKKEVEKKHWDTKISQLQEEGQKRMAAYPAGSANYKSRERALEVELREPRYRSRECEKDIIVLKKLIAEPPPERIKITGYPLIEHNLPAPPEPSDDVQEFLLAGGTELGKKAIIGAIWWAIKKYGLKLLVMAGAAAGAL